MRDYNSRSEYTSWMARK